MLISHIEEIQCLKEIPHAHTKMKDNLDQIHHFSY